MPAMQKSNPEKLHKELKCDCCGKILTTDGKSITIVRFQAIGGGAYCHPCAEKIKKDRKTSTSWASD